MKILTHSQLVSTLDAMRGTVIVGITSLTDAKARKTGNPFTLPILKRIRTSGFTGADYGSGVLREANRQGVDGSNFQIEELPWGKWLVFGKVILHKGNYYLRTQTAPGQRRTVPARLLGYFDASGNRLNPQDVKPFLPEKRESNKQQEDAGLTDTIWIRTYKFDSIQSIRINGQTYGLIA